LENNSEELQKWIKKRNTANLYRSPLSCEYATKVRDSYLTNYEKPTDLRGLLNLFLLFSVLNYYRLIANHLKEIQFYKNFIVLMKLSNEPNSIYLFVLFGVFLSFIYVVQNKSFKMN